MCHRCCTEGLSAVQIACMLVRISGNSAAAAHFNAALQWLSVLRLVRLPKGFSIVKASYLPDEKGVYLL